MTTPSYCIISTGHSWHCRGSASALHYRGGQYKGLHPRLGEVRSEGPRGGISELGNPNAGYTKCSIDLSLTLWCTLLRLLAPKSSPLPASVLPVVAPALAPAPAPASAPAPAHGTMLLRHQFFKHSQASIMSSPSAFLSGVIVRNAKTAVLQRRTTEGQMALLQRGSTAAVPL
jgi:hypothetical protein